MPPRQPHLSGILSLRRSLATSASTTPYRAVTFSKPGAPRDAVSIRTFPEPLEPPKEGHVQLRIRMAPINPSDINVIQGVYPDKPRPRDNLIPNATVMIPGNEGVGEVVAVGAGVQGLKTGDRVVMATSQPGTWANYMNIPEQHVINVGQQISDVQAATISINPTTALSMLRHFVDLKPGDYVVQNGANSAVGQAVIQLAAKMGIKTINFVRSRPDLADLKSYLASLGATETLTYEDLNDKDKFSEIKSSIKPAKLALNCVSGKDGSLITKLLGMNSHLVTYGGMSVAPLQLPTSLFIFKNVTAHGFMMSRWFRENPLEAREKLVKELVGMIEEGALKEPAHSIVKLEGSDEQALETLKNSIQSLEKGSHGKKILIQFD